MIESTDQNHATPPIPPRPKKHPQQSRSRFLVKSIKDACLKILSEEGPNGLTATHIADVSGVAMGSIYQYFPNVDAIIATIFEDIIEAEFEIARKKADSEWRQMTLEESMMSMIRGAIGFHRRLLRLDSDFHRRFYQTFDLQHWLNRTTGNPLASTRVIRDILLAHKGEYPSRNPEMEAFILTASFRSSILDAVKFYPEYLDAPEFAQYLLRLCLGVIGLQARE